jgi:hypothetical protein
VDVQLKDRACQGTGSQVIGAMIVIGWHSRGFGELAVNMKRRPTRLLIPQDDLA